MKVNIKITSETTELGRGTLFDISMYGIFVLIFAYIGISSLFDGEIGTTIVAFAVGLIDLVIFISNIKKRKKYKNTLTKLLK